mgnify:CR=1 FL=1
MTHLENYRSNGFKVEHLPFKFDKIADCVGERLVRQARHFGYRQRKAFRYLKLRIATIAKLAFYPSCKTAMKAGGSLVSHLSAATCPVTAYGKAPVSWRNSPNRCSLT